VLVAVGEFIAFRAQDAVGGQAPDRSSAGVAQIEGTGGLQTVATRCMVSATKSAVDASSGPIVGEHVPQQTPAEYKRPRPLTASRSIQRSSSS
jgi:hypothetical protein